MNPNSGTTADTTPICAFSTPITGNPGNWLKTTYNAAIVAIKAMVRVDIFN
jgi:hypothetical protein